MDLDELERRGHIKRLPIDVKKTGDSLNLAKRDVNVAKGVLEENCDWAFAIAYNAMLQAVRALMFSKGFRPTGSNQHIAVIRFAELFMKEEDVIILDRMRRKRHATIYDTAGTISEIEAENIVKRAEKLVREIVKMIGDEG